VHSLACGTNRRDGSPAEGSPVIGPADVSPGLDGEPAHELMAFAAEFKADLVAAGAHGRSVLGRLVLGSVSSKLVRTAHCWVLVAPPRQGVSEAQAIDADGDDAIDTA
jgi:hypothetical protein